MFYLHTLKKPILIVSLLFILVLNVQAQYTLKLSDVEFDAATGTITDYLNTTEKDIIIPSGFVVEGKEVAVKIIGDKAFYGKLLTNVNLPNSIVNIGQSAFLYNVLTALNIPNNVKYIGTSAFSNNLLETVIFEEESMIASIDTCAFANNTYLISIQLPTNNTQGFTDYKDRLGNSYNSGIQISNFNELYYVDIPHTLELSEVEFDAEIGRIINYTYPVFKNIVIPSSFNINGREIEVTTIGSKSFYKKSLTSVVISNSIIGIGWYAFNSNYLKVVEFEDNSEIISIQESAFRGNVDLNSIKLPNNILPEFVEYNDGFGNTYAGGADITNFATCYYCNIPYTLALNDVDFSVETGTINEYVSSRIYAYLSIPSSFLVEGVEVPVTKIGPRAFENQFLTSMKIANSVTNIGDYAFGFNRLASVEFGTGVERIGRRAFYRNKLSSVSFGDNVTDIGYGAFMFNSLTSVELGSGIEHIEKHAFSYNKITSVSIGDNVTTIDDFAFYYNLQLTSINLGKSVNYIGRRAFYRCKLASVTIPFSVKTIGKEAFKGNEITAINFEANSQIELIEYAAFNENANLYSITLPTNAVTGFSEYKDNYENSYAEGSDITNFIAIYKIDYTPVYTPYTLTIDDVSFQTETGTILDYVNPIYKNIIIPSSFIVEGNTIEVKRIGNSAFYNNGLTSVTIPNSVLNIGANAFASNALITVSFDSNSSIVSIDGNAFLNNTSLSGIVLPTNATAGFVEYKDIDGNTYAAGNTITNFITQYYLDIPYMLTLDDVSFNATSHTITDYLNPVCKNIIIPSGFIVDGQKIPITHIDNSAFSNKGITSVTIPNSVIYIGENAFASNELTAVNFESNSSIFRIEGLAFSGNTSLSGITLPVNATLGFTEYKDEEGNGYTAGNTITNFDTHYYLDLPYVLDIEDVIFNSDKGAIEEYLNPVYKNIIIPSAFEIDGQFVTVERINSRAFSNSALTSVTIPSSVKYIYGGAFESNRLTSVEFEEDSQLSIIGKAAFGSNTSLTSITLPSNSNMDFTAYKDVFGNSYGSNSQITDFDVTYYIPYKLQLSDIVFDTSSGTIIDYLSEIPRGIVIPSSFIVNGQEVTLERIGTRAFSWKRLFYLDIPNSVSYIGKAALSFNALSHVDIPNCVNTIESSAFWENDLSSVNFEDNSRLVLIGEYAFGANALTSITLPSNQTDGFTHYLDNAGLTYNAEEQIANFSEGYYIPNSYLINYNLKGGKNSLDNPTTYISTTGIASLEPATKEGYEFTGWFSDNTFTTQVSSINIGTTGVVELYAKFDVVNNTKIDSPEIINYLSVYPNPASNQIRLVGFKKDEVLNIYNLSGAIVIKQLNRNNNLDISNLQNGIYYLQNEQGEVVKFVKR